MRTFLTGLVTAAALGAAVLLAPSPPLSTPHAAPAPRPTRAGPAAAMFGGGPGRNLANASARDLPADWSVAVGTERNILWSAQLGSKAYGGPVVCGGKVFIGTNNNRPRDPAVRGDRGVVMCFRASDGQFLWQAVHDKMATGRVHDWPEIGVSSVPAVEGDRLYYVSNRCELVCAATEGLPGGQARVVWRLDLFTDLKVHPHNASTCSPLLFGDRLYVVTGNGVDEGHINIPAPEAPSFLAVEKRTGKVLWSSSAPGKRILHGQWSSPAGAVVDGRPQVIFPGGDGWLYAFSPEGELLWKYDCNPKGAVRRNGNGNTRNAFIATPAVWQNKLYVGVGDDPEHKQGVGHLWCVDIGKAPTKAEKDLSPWSDPRVEAPNRFDPADPRNKGSALVWHHGGNDPAAARGYRFGRTMSTCAVQDGLCYAADFDGVVYCLGARTGQKHWEYDMGCDTWSSPYAADGKVYVGNDDGVMHVFAQGKKLRLVSRVPMRGKIRATPLACDGVLYVATENPCKLWAVKAR